MVLVGGNGDDTLIGGSGDDQLHGQNGNDFISGGDADQIFASAGDDFIELDGLPDGALIDGGAGIDMLDLSKLSTGANINLSDGVVDVGSFVSQFTEVEVIIGSSHADTIQGTSKSDTLIGGDGSDLISGGLGSDTIIGGQGDDLLLGGDGDDLFIGSDGGNTILGGDGSDTVKFEKNLSEFSITSNSDQSISVTDTSQNSGSTILTEVEFLEFSDGLHSVNDFTSLIQVNPDGVGTVNSFGTSTGDMFVLGDGFVPVSFDTELITNGGFETGNNTGWTQRDTGSGSFFIFWHSKFIFCDSEYAGTSRVAAIR